MADKKQLQTYLSLSAELYDLDKSTVPHDEFAFYLDYIKASKAPILEPMCGSGRFLIPLMEAGFDVQGFDASPFMLDALRQKCRAKNLTPKIWRAFLQDLDLTERYGLIFIPDSSLNLILNIDELKCSLDRIYEHLLPGGSFVFELATINYTRQIQVGASNTFTVFRPDGKRIVQNVQVLPFDGQIASTSSRYELIEDDQVFGIETEIFRLFLHDPDKIETYLREAGFRNIRRLKPFNKVEVATCSDSIVIFECKKGG